MKKKSYLYKNVKANLELFEIYKIMSNDVLFRAKASVINFSFYFFTT